MGDACDNTAWGLSWVGELPGERAILDDTAKGFSPFPAEGLARCAVAVLLLGVLALASTGPVTAFASLALTAGRPGVLLVGVRLRVVNEASAFSSA